MGVPGTTLEGERRPLREEERAEELGAAWEERGQLNEALVHAQTNERTC